MTKPPALDQGYKDSVTTQDMKKSGRKGEEVSPHQSSVNDMVCE